MRPLFLLPGFPGDGLSVQLPDSSRRSDTRRGPIAWSRRGSPMQPLQSLFSWAEFMTEQQVKPKGRSRKAEPSYPSLFDWALSLEQKREAQAARP